MIVVTVARKPMSEPSVAANVLKHGTGALNIAAARVSTRDNLDGGAYAKDGQDRDDGYENWRFKRKGDAGEYKQPSGRWPANLILQHLPECRYVGLRQVRGIRGGNSPVRRGGAHIDAGGHQTIGREQTYHDFANPDGTETVEAWDCAPGCPVADLDASTGDRPVSGAARTGRPSLTDTGPSTVDFGINKGTGALHDDSGGASRYFQQVGGQQGDDG